jgi:hypothetical protein
MTSSVALFDSQEATFVNTKATAGLGVSREEGAEFFKPTSDLTTSESSKKLAQSLVVPQADQIKYKPDPNSQRITAATILNVKSLLAGRPSRHDFNEAFKQFKTIDRASVPEKSENDFLEIAVKLAKNVEYRTQIVGQIKAYLQGKKQTDTISAREQVLLNALLGDEIPNDTTVGQAIALLSPEAKQVEVDASGMQKVLNDRDKAHILKVAGIDIDKVVSDIKIINNWLEDRLRKQEELLLANNQRSQVLPDLLNFALNKTSGSETFAELAAKLIDSSVKKDETNLQVAQKKADQNKYESEKMNPIG